MTTSFPETKTGLRFGLATLATTACLAAILAAGPVRAQDNPVLAKVNGVEIRQSDVALAEEELGPSLAQMDPATKKDNVLAFLIDLRIVAKAAEDKKVENSEDFKKRLAFTRSRLLMDSLLATEGKAATTDEAIKVFVDLAGVSCACSTRVNFLARVDDALPGTAQVTVGRPTPETVPPVPTPHTNTVTLPRVCSQISGPVVR